MKIPYQTGIVTLTSKFGWRNLNGQRDYHKGIDLSGTDKTLVAPCDGVIGSSTIITDKSNLTWQWGNYIRIDTPDGLRIFMCHMAQRKVKVGQKVKAGDVVGIEGNTGYSFGSHCHFEVRKNGESVDPTPYLGIKNEWGQYAMAKPTATAKTYKDDYDEDGVTYSKAKNFSIRYIDADKRKGGVKRYANGGFFAYYREDNTGFTLPVGHLVCDIPKVPKTPEKYLTKYVYGSRLIYPVTANQSQQFRGKSLTTLLVTFEGKARIERVYNLPSGIQYAVSGVPVIRDGQPVTMADVSAEGYGTDSLYNTSRNLIGLRDGEIWVITLKTSTANYIESREIWNKLKGQGFDDVISLDGGGSYVRVEGLTRRSTGGKRPINNIIVF